MTTTWLLTTVVTDERINAYNNGPADAHQSDNESSITLE